MTVTVTNIVAGPYTATGEAQNLPFAFKVFTPEEIEVVTGADRAPVDPSLYTVTRNLAVDGQALEGGSVSLAPGAVEAGASIRLIAKPFKTQELYFSDTGSRLRNLNEVADRSALRALRAQYDGAMEGAGQELLEAAIEAGTEAGRDAGQTAAQDKAAKAANLTDLHDRLAATNALEFKLAIEDGPQRSLLDKARDVINVRDFGATGDGVTDDTAAFQLALDTAKEAGLGEIIIPPPVQSYIISDTLYYASETPIRIRASAPCSGFSVYTNRQATLTFVGPHNKHCLHFETSGATVDNPLRGLELDSILVRRLSGDFAAKGSGGAGFCLKGVVGFKLLNCSAVGFDNDLYLDDNPASAGSNAIRCFAGYILGFIGMQAGSYRVLHKGAGEIVYDQPRLSIQGRAGYIADLAIMLGTNGAGPDHNHIRGGVLIGGSNRPEYNLFVNAGFFNKAENTSFERANIAGAYVTTNGSLGDRDHFSFNDCWWDGQRGYCLDVLGARVNVHNPRGQQVLASENGGVAPTAPAFRFRGQTTPGTPIIGGSFTGGGVIYFTGPTAIEVDNLARMNIIPPLMVDRTASLKPCIILGANTTRCTIISPQIGTATGEPQMGGGNHTYVGESGVMMGGGQILRRSAVLTTTLNSSGVGSVAHGTTLTKVKNAVAFLNKGSTKVPIPIQFIDGSNIQVASTAADAGLTVEIVFERIP